MALFSCLTYLYVDLIKYLCWGMALQYFIEYIKEPKPIEVWAKLMLISLRITPNTADRPKLW